MEKQGADRSENLVSGLLIFDFLLLSFIFLIFCTCGFFFFPLFFCFCSTSLFNLNSNQAIFNYVIFQKLFVLQCCASIYRTYLSCRYFISSNLLLFRDFSRILFNYFHINPLLRSFFLFFSLILPSQFIFLYLSHVFNYFLKG